MPSARRRPPHRLAPDIGHADERRALQIGGLSIAESELHPTQQAFIDHDALALCRRHTARGRSPSRRRRDPIVRAAHRAARVDRQGLLPAVHEHSRRHRRRSRGGFCNGSPRATAVLRAGRLMTRFAETSVRSPAGARESRLSLSPSLARHGCSRSVREGGDSLRQSGNWSPAHPRGN